MTRAAACRVGLMVLLGVAAATSRSSAAEFLEFYKLGLAALEASDWEQASDWIEKALAAQPRAKARVTRSFYFRRYMPHFYLGVARFGLGDCRGALEAWREAEAQEVVTRSAEFEQLLRDRAVCRQRLEDLERAREEALRGLAEADAAAQDSAQILSQLARESEASAANLSERQDVAVELLRAARARAQTAQSERRDFEWATSSAAEARAEFEAILGAAQEQRLQIQYHRRQLLTDLAAQVAKAEKAMAESEHLRPYPSEVQARRGEIDRLLSRAATVGDTAELTELEALRQDLVAAVGRLERSTEPPPAELASAAEAYLAGEYRSVLVLLADQEFAAPKAAAQAHLLRSAALYAQYHASGASDARLLESARLEIRACRAVAPTMLPPASVFSPRFVAFFEATGPAARAEPTGGDPPPSR